MRFGFAVKALGQEGLKSNDSRRWQNKPHLRVSIEYLHEMFAYLAKAGITMYRMASDLAPYVTHPEMPQFHHQIEEAGSELRALGQAARQQGLRLSLHPSQFIVLNSPDPVLTEKSVQDLLAGARILDTMEMGPEAVLVIHVGGTYGDHTSGCDRWVETYKKLPEPVRRRLVLENDDIRYSAADVLEIHDRTGVPLIFDYQHFWCNNPEGLDLVYSVERFLASWPGGVRPKIHYSSPNTGMREVQQRDRKTGKLKKALVPPIWTGHADFVNPFEFATFVRMLGDPHPFDVMLEAKSKDLALLRLRRDLPRYAPDVARRFGLAPDPPDACNDDIIEELGDAAAGEE
ncbi:MAG: UV DNA damage repair endonuclease UvsE [Cytophagales bacterium]|nr:UV DNA damage repair endonuclease UvsE [Armatimonadota bacterium]